MSLGRLYRGGSGADCHVLSSGGKEASQEFDRVISAYGGKGEEGVRMRTDLPTQAQGASSPGGGGPSPSDAQEEWC